MSFVDISKDYTNVDVKRKYYIENDILFFPYRILLKTLEGIISSDKAERVLVTYFKYREFPVEIGYVYPRRANKELKLLALYGNICPFCKLPMIRSIKGKDYSTNNTFNNQDNILSIEHILAKSKGGLHRFDNLCLSCRKCNADKRSNIIPIN